MLPDWENLIKKLKCGLDIKISTCSIINVIKAINMRLNSKQHRLVKIQRVLNEFILKNLNLI